MPNLEDAGLFEFPEHVSSPLEYMGLAADPELDLEHIMEFRV